MRTLHLSWSCLALAFAVSGHASPAAVKCQFGYALGAWNLPSGLGSGFMNGKLVDGNTNITTYVIDAKLHNVPTPCLSCIAGTIQGTIDADGVFPPDYVVKGTYSGLSLTGSGTFAADIFPPLGTTAVGKIVGEFKDPPVGTTPIGKFQGDWEICP